MNMNVALVSEIPLNAFQHPVGGKHVVGGNIRDATYDFPKVGRL